MELLGSCWGAAGEDRVGKYEAIEFGLQLGSGMGGGSLCCVLLQIAPLILHLYVISPRKHLFEETSENKTT